MPKDEHSELFMRSVIATIILASLLAFIDPLKLSVAFAGDVSVAQLGFNVSAWVGYAFLSGIFFAIVFNLIEEK